MKKSGPFTVDTVWNPSTGGSATEPGLTVTGRVDGEAYTVSAGARSLTISNPDGATLSTTVELASDGSSVAVTGATTTSPSWTAPSGGTIGEAVQVQVTATKDGLTSQVSFTERVAGSNYTALVAAADPSDVSLSGGSTSSSGSTRTFTNPTGGSGSYTLAVTSTQLDGTGATLQGNNSTGYYIDSLEDGDTVEVIGSFSDDATGQVVKNRFVVTVAVTVYTEPSITVADRVDGEAYTVSSGARSLTITNTDSATLLTTVEKASDGTAIPVTGSATTTPSWTAPTGGASGESYQVLVTATKNSLSSSVAFTERVAADTAPSLSVTGRVDGEAYNVTAGARSLSITTDAGATLSTTVELASTGAALTVTDPTTTTPSWTAPSGGTDGDAYQVKVVSTKGGLSSTLSFTERVAGASSTAPSVSVTGRVDGEAYTVSSGARSLSITATSGSTLSTTVEVASTGAALTVTDSTTTTPSWTAPSGGATGEAVQVQVTATKDGLSSTFSFTERVASGGMYDVAPEVVDLTDGTWTLYDPDSLVQSISFDSATGEHTVTMNELAAPTSDYNPCGGSGYRGPRWYKALEISGNAVNADDVITMIHTADGTITTAGWNQRNIWGTTCFPDGLIVGNTGICGIGIVWQSPTGTEQGVYRLGSAYTQASALNVNQWGLIQRGRDHILGSLNTSFKTGGAVATVAGNVLEQILGPAQYGLPVYLYFGLGIKTNTSTIPLNSQTKFKLGYQALTLTGV